MSSVGPSDACARQLVLAPNLLSLARVPLGVLFAVEVAAARNRVALATLAMAAATDVADGYFARRLRQETAIGRVIDPLADKVFFVLAAVALARGGRFVPVAVLLLSTREVAQLALAGVLAVRGRLGHAGTRTPSSAAGKLTTAFQTAAAAAALVCLDARGPLVMAAAICGAVAGAQYWAAGLASAA